MTGTAALQWTIYIDRSVRDVFSVVSDPHRDVVWRSAVRSCRQTVGGGCHLGARYELVHRPVVLSPFVTTRTEIITYEPPNVIAWRQLDRIAANLVRYEVMPHGSLTCFTQRRQVDWQIPPRLRRWADRLMVRAVAADMRQLKYRLESSFPSQVETIARYLP